MVALAAADTAAAAAAAAAAAVSVHWHCQPANCRRLWLAFAIVVPLSVESGASTYPPFFAFVTIAALAAVVAAAAPTTTCATRAIVYHWARHR